MKRDAGLATVFLVGIAATAGLSSFKSKPAPDASSQVADAASASAQPASTKPAAAPTKTPIDKGVCASLEARLQTFFAVNQDANNDTLSVAPKSCQADAKTPLTSTGFAAKAQHTRFIIATLPDPLHTHLPLIFDRNAEAIQQAASDSGYTYDSSWLPWDTDRTSYPLIADQDQADDRRDAREQQPGILLFRLSIDAPDSPGTSAVAPAEEAPKTHRHPYDSGLIVFVVGEDATGGIHRHQFKNAVAWIEALRPTQGTHQDVQILGPSFSGSLPSLVELLANSDVAKTLSPAPSKSLQIYSGHVSNNASALWLCKAINGVIDETEALKNLNIDFLSFEQDEDTTLARYNTYLDGIGLPPERRAIISEDETAYGHFRPSSTPQPDPPKGCYLPPPQPVPGVVTLYYPRDISALRAAYQAQSLFGPTPSPSTSDPTRRTLPNDIADPDSNQHDTIRTYGGAQTALSQEAVLLQIVNLLRAHQSQFILLRSSNTLDQLFLAHFLKLTYPEGRVVILGSDLLLQRETGSAGLNGIMTLGNYPLLPQLDEWTGTFRPGLSNHFHRAFTQFTAQGTYIAATALLRQDPSFLVPPGTVAAPADPCPIPPTTPPPPPTPRVAFLPFDCVPQNTSTGPDKPFPDYAQPFWLQNRAHTAHRPSSWLAVLGNDGFAPIAALDGNPITPYQQSILPSLTALLHLSRWDHLASDLTSLPTTIQDSILAIFRGLRGHTSNQRLGNCYLWPILPLTMRFAVIAVLLWALFHAYCCVLPSITLKPERRAYFVRPRKWMNDPYPPTPKPPPDRILPWSHLALIVASSVLLVMAATILAWGYGWLFDQGVPFRNPTFFILFPLLVWLIALLAIFANTLLELIYNPPAGPPLPVLKILKTVILPALTFVLATFTFFCALLLFLDNTVPPDVRTLSYLRAMNLTTGVSPVVPLGLLILGLYAWCWYSLRGLSLFGADRPLLPSRDGLQLNLPGTRKKDFLTMLSEEGAGQPIHDLSLPFHPKTWLYAAITALTLWGIISLLPGGSALRSLGIQRYSTLVCLGIVLAASILLANTWQLLSLWLKLQALLIFLDKLPLRRTLQAMHGFSWGSIWKMGGNVLDIRYKLFYRQFESLNHLQSSFTDCPPNSTLLNANAARDRQHWIDKLEKTRTNRINFAAWYAQNWNKSVARDLSALQEVQKKVAEIAADILTHILVPAWTAETESILLAPAPAPDAPGPDTFPAVSKLEPHIRNAEEVVCLVYLGFIQNILGRIRTLVTAIIALFLSIALVLPSYPFDPRPLLTGAVVTLFLITGLAVFLVYSQMFRDPTLSHLTNTKPGELGSEFWLKFVSFGVGPIFGLLATISPHLSDFLFSWLQPSLSSIK